MSSFVISLFFLFFFALIRAQAKSHATLIKTFHNDYNFMMGGNNDSNNATTKKNCTNATTGFINYDCKWGPLKANSTCIKENRTNKTNHNTTIFPISLSPTHQYQHHHSKTKTKKRTKTKTRLRNKFHNSNHTHGKKRSLFIGGSITDLKGDRLSQCVLRIESHYKDINHCTGIIIGIYI